MKRNDEHSDLEFLGNVRKVAAPPFLFTRITQKIENLRADTLPKGKAWVIGLSFLVLVLINVAVMSKISRQSRESRLMEYMDLTNDNQLYR